MLPCPLSIQKSSYMTVHVHECTVHVDVSVCTRTYTVLYRISQENDQDVFIVNPDTELEMFSGNSEEVQYAVSRFWPLHVSSIVLFPKAWVVAPALKWYLTFGSRKSNTTTHAVMTVFLMYRCTVYRLFSACVHSSPLTLFANLPNSAFSASSFLNESTQPHHSRVSLSLIIHNLC